ncbi:MAG TPA: UvrD-helicase domain-containing protein [Vicinamibacterales bacterium]|nr:UvrD-helicase domain-containing protein [Vicinamibacterales bacterium]
MSKRNNQLPLFDALDPRSSSPPPDDDPDTAAREFARDPDHNVVLEASAGTGKTSVLVTRYVNLLARGVDPANILAITFTRKAAAEMRERIIRELRRAAELSTFDRARWNAIRDRLADIQISTIDAFCLSLLREFPLEADLDPGFGMADETEVPRLVDQSLDKSLATFVARAKREPDMALVLAQLGLTRTREGLAYLLQRRLVAWDVLDRFLARGPADLDADSACRRAIGAMIDLFDIIPDGPPPPLGYGESSPKHASDGDRANAAREMFLADGPVHQPRYQLLAQDLRRLDSFRTAGNPAVRGLMNRLGAHILKADGKPRAIGRLHPYNVEDYSTPDAGKRHRQEVVRLGPSVENIYRAFSRDLNVVLARGIRQMFAIALAQYQKTLQDRSLLDFSDVLQRAVALLGRMDEFSQSRYRLEGRYHHVLVDEFQDTSRKQWELISLLVKAWGEGAGLATQPSIFIVGDRKQSIYRFRDADVSVLAEAGLFIDGLRPGTGARRSIARSFRAVPQLLGFVNDLFSEVGRDARRPDDFKYDQDDRFPIDDPPSGPAAPRLLSSEGGALGVVTGADAEQCAAAVAAEIARVLREETVRDKQTGIARAARPGDIGILFRSRTSHREFEAALEAAGIPTYVYKGLGFFDADEIKDVSALIRFLANPSSELRAAAFLRSRFVRVSDEALAALAPRLAAALTDPVPPSAIAGLLDDDRRALEQARLHVPCWLAQVDRVPPADLIEQLLPETAYAFELRGTRRQQAWENVKKMRGLIRRIQNRGYATLARIADHLDSLTAGDESNAVLEALDAVNLMTVHASKGLEFPIVFAVNLARGASGFPRPVRVSGDEVSVGPFVSESDEVERFREREETKRLLYVALTRARDRLYLGSVLKDGAFVAGRGSLADVLPDSLRALFVRAAQETSGSVEWTAESGRPYRFRVCSDLPVEAQSEEAICSTMPVQISGGTGTFVDDFGALTDPDAVERLAVTESLPLDSATDERQGPGAGVYADEALVGTLVHRLFQFGAELLASAGVKDFASLAERQDFARLAEHQDFAPLAEKLLRPEERATAADARGAVAKAVDVWLAMARQPDVASLLDSGERLHELTFSLVAPAAPKPRVLRGTIDCLIRRADGSIVVVEFKTGPIAATHAAQIDTYVQAVKAMYPEAAVTGRVVYPR